LDEKHLKIINVTLLNNKDCIVARVPG